LADIDKFSSNEPQQQLQQLTNIRCLWFSRFTEHATCPPISDVVLVTCLASRGVWR